MGNRIDASRFDTSVMRIAGWFLGGLFIVAWAWLMWAGWGRVIEVVL